MNEEIHVGEAIKRRLKEKGLKVTEFADAIHCSRTNVYTLFKRRSIDMELLSRISGVLEHDFVSAYCTRRPTYLVILEVDEQRLPAFLHDTSLVLVKKTTE
jgi:transcriptional regulator with XRE-family HTH domain